MRPSAPEDAESLLRSLKRHLREDRLRTGADNVLLFGPEGSPFWAAKLPLDPAHLRCLERALEAIEAQAALQPRPFLGTDVEGGFSFGALERPELYFVLVGPPGAPHAPAAAQLLKSGLEQWLDGAPGRRNGDWVRTVPSDL